MSSLQNVCREKDDSYNSSFSRKSFVIFLSCLKSEIHSMTVIKVVFIITNKLYILPLILLLTIIFSNKSDT